MSDVILLEGEALKAYLDNLASKLPAEFVEATEHMYRCNCPKCLDWWVDMGPDGERDAPDEFGPFAWEVVRDRAAQRGVEFRRGDTP